MDPFIKDCIGWDVVNWSGAFNFWEKNAYLPPEPLQCLELGANSGGMSLWLARRGYHVLCTDVKLPGPRALALHKKYGVSELVKYEAIDATAIPYRDHFDIVIFKSMLGAVGRNGRDDLQKRCMEEIRQCLKPGGQLLFAENLKATRLHQFLRHHFVKWSRSWNYLEYDKINRLMSGFQSCNHKTAGFLGLFGINEPVRNLLGHMDRTFVNHIVGRRNHYILFCAAKK